MEDSERIGYVYMITSPTDRIYVGSTIDLAERWRTYKKLECKNQRKLYNSLNKYTPSMHTFEVVWSGNSLERLKYEHLIGIYYEVIENGLNLQLPGYNDVPAITSDETKRKLSLSKIGNQVCKGRKMSQKNKDILALINKGNKHGLNTKRTKEQREKMSKAMKGIKKSESGRLNIALSNKSRNKNK